METFAISCDQSISISSQVVPGIMKSKHCELLVHNRLNAILHCYYYLKVVNKGENILIQDFALLAMEFLLIHDEEYAS
jgi:hypothetical protein